MNRIWLSIFALVLGCLPLALPAQAQAAGQKPPSPTELCPLSTHDDLYLHCIGERVTLSGARLMDITTQYPDVSGVGGYVHHATLRSALGQIGLNARKPIKCRKAITADGVLRVERITRANGIVAVTPYVQALEIRCK
ncbi:MAG: hypothetical protein E6Q88_04795 [Lysobacteraceae bacterium]|nr:MAG: hypothetical protein E6Q88_04795 [Xanthomonadaceae bacterium]